ncbi:MAG: polysaccharide biosynthesis C-terminal domain-containing protein, partial [Pseudomonadota bacterium]
FQSNEIAKIELIGKWSSRLTFAITLAAGALLFLFGPVIIQLLFGSAFKAAYWSLAVMVVAQCVNAAFGPVGTILNMTAYARTSLAGFSAAAIVNVIICTVLIPVMGHIGAAVAALVSTITWNIYLTRMLKKHLGIRVSFI